MALERELGAGEEIRLAREMSLFSVTMIGVGAMIGAGIFVLTGIAAGVAGPGLILTFLLNGLVTLFTAMAYAELGSCFHDAGGGYLWVKESLPQPNGFLAGWMSWFAHAVACSLYALGFGAYFGHVLTEGFGVEIHGLPFSLEKILAVVACVLFAYVNFRGASETGKIGNIVTMAKVVVIALFIAFGLAVIAHKTGWQVEFTPFLPTGLSGVFMAMGLTFIAFQGYEVIAQTSEEIINPKRNVPRAVFFALAIVIPIYLLVAFTALGAISGKGVPTWEYLGAQKEIAMVEAARQFLPGGAVIFLIGGLLSTLSALNATVYSSSRVAFAMGRDANLPDVFSRVHPRRHTPHLSILASTIIVIGMALLLPIEDVASAADLMFLFVFMQVNVAVIRLRKKRPDLARGFRIPLMPLIPILGILCQVFVAYYLFQYSPKAFLTAGVWIAVGVAIHYTYASKKEAEVVTLRGTLARLARKEYRILLAVGDEKNVEPLSSVALALASHFDGDLVALSVVEVPFQSPLMSGIGLPEVVPKRALLRRVEHLAKEEGVDCQRVIKIAHRLSKGILETAREEHCNFILLGRSPRPHFASRVLSTVVNQVLKDAPCHVAAIKRDGTHEVNRIILPVEDNANSRLALELLPALSTRWKSKPKVLTVVSGPFPQLQGEDLLKKLTQSVTLPPMTETLVVTGDDVADRVLAEVKKGDILMLGQAQRSGLQRLLAPTIPDEIADQTDQMTILISAYQKRQKPSLWMRLLTGR